MERKEKNLKKSKVKSTGFIYLSSFMATLKVERIRLYLPSIKYDNEVIKIFLDKCPLSILSSLSQGYLLVSIAVLVTQFVYSRRHMLFPGTDIIYFISVIDFCITVLQISFSTDMSSLLLLPAMCCTNTYYARSVLLLNSIPFRWDV